MTIVTLFEEDLYLFETPPPAYLFLYFLTFESFDMEKMNIEYIFLLGNFKILINTDTKYN